MQFSFARSILLAIVLVSTHVASAAPIDADGSINDMMFRPRSAQKAALRMRATPVEQFYPRSAAADLMRFITRNTIAQPAPVASPLARRRLRTRATKPASKPAPKAAPAKVAPKGATKAAPASKATTCKSKRNGDDCAFTAAPGATFKIGSEEGKLGAKVGSTKKAAVYDVDTWHGKPHPGMVLKVFTAPLFLGRHEVDALKAVGQHIASGEVGGKQVIAMHKAQGESLDTIFASLKHDKTKIEAFMKPIRPVIAQTVAQLAKKGYYHNDLHTGNIFIDKQFGNAVTLIDWGQAVKKGETGFLDDEKKILAIVEKNLKSSS